MTDRGLATQRGQGSLVRLKGAGQPELRVGRCERGCRFYGIAEAVPEAFLLFLVVGDLLKELVLCFQKEAGRLHLVRRRAAAKTSQQV